MYELIIDAGRPRRERVRELWRYRELFYFLAWRDILVRYKQTVAGVSWALLRPLLTMLVLTLVFGKLAKMPAGDTPYPILVFCGLLPWQFISTSLSESGNSLLNNSALISKIYFPRVTVPAASVMTSLVDLLLSGALLVAVLMWYRHLPGPQVLLLPMFVVMAVAAALGAGLWISALTVKYRDFRFVVPFLVQFGLYVSPVGFSSDVVPERWRVLYSLNPTVGVIDGFRWAIIGGDQALYGPGFMLSLFVVVVLLVTGLRYFYATERTFADLI